MITLAYITSRAAPRWEWFADSLCEQVPMDQRGDIQVIFVDGKLWSPWLDFHPNPKFDGRVALAHPFYHDAKRRFDLEMVVGKRFDFTHIPPKPCVHQGPFRRTKRDFFCATNSRNTAIIATKSPYLVCVDDLSFLMPGWMGQVSHAAEHGYVVCGAYRKVLKLDSGKDLNGALAVKFKNFKDGIDSRWGGGSDGGIVPCGGGSLFGCSFGVPLESALAVDGFDPACNGDGGEDTDYGVRLQRTGVPLFYNRNMLTLESEEGHHDGETLPRDRKLVSKDRLPADYGSWTVPNDAERYYSDHVVLNRRNHDTERVLPLFPEGLRAMREQFLATGMVPIPEEPAVDWRDGTALGDL